MKLSERAWGSCSEVIEAIKVHPFNQELMDGKLPMNKFAYYIEQDALYLKDFARSLAIIASKVPIEYLRDFLCFSESTFIAEQEILHKFFRRTFSFRKTKLLTSATLGYTSYLLNICSNKPVEIGIAAVLPCFWVYREIGLFIAKQSKRNNPYARWIETYTSDDFSSTVDKVIDIFNALARNTTDAVQNKMLDAFYKSTCLEWHFWNDCYSETVFDDFCLQKVRITINIST